jgi:hypothetical protein
MFDPVRMMHMLVKCIEEMEHRLMFTPKETGEFRELMDECDDKYKRLYELADAHTGPPEDIPEMIRFIYE